MNILNYQVNLPKTNFPMRANLPKREPEIIKFWNEINLYNIFLHPKKNKGTFIIHDGPPYANGEIHLGHAFNKIVKDIINKSKLMLGFRVPYIPGWDCHGLPIELNVEKKIGKAGIKVSIDDFITSCREYAANQIRLQKASFERLGVIGNWNDHYSTMNFSYEANAVKALAKIIDSGYVIRGYKPVQWCFDCMSALAEAEVEYKEKSSQAIDVRFRVLNSYNKFNVDKVSIPIWTTTPWTLPANEAVALNSNLKYVLVHCIDNEEYFIIAEELLHSVMIRYKINHYSVISVYKGVDFSNIKLQHPFIDSKYVPIVFGDHVTTNVGTGAVHTAPAHGYDDFNIGLKYNLPINSPINEYGIFSKTNDFFSGIKIFDANDLIINKLKVNGNLVNESTILHNYPYCWRHKTPLIYRATKQWFIKLEEEDKKSNSSLKFLASKELKKIEWIPNQGMNIMEKMIFSRHDWCISRQRIWGLPITLFVKKDDNSIHPDMMGLINKFIAPQIEKYGLAYWYKLDAISFLKSYSSDINPEQYEKVTDTIDVWFDSGISHYCVLEQREELQTISDLYLEGIDQYRGWFQSSLLTSIALGKGIPYKKVVAHGFIVDAAGRKMSKSIGNVIAPSQVVNKYGADILRLWAATSYMHNDITASDEIFSRNVDIYRMIRNVSRFLLGNLYDFNYKVDRVPAIDMLSLDRFAVAQFLLLIKESINNYDNYQFYLICNNLCRLLTKEISSFYFGVIKDRLYTMKNNSLGRRSAQTALFYILELLIKLIAPILSFTAEEVWQELKYLEKQQNNNDRLNSIFMSNWDDILENIDIKYETEYDNVKYWLDMLKIRDLINKELEILRAKGMIGSSLEVNLDLFVNENLLLQLSKIKDELHFIFMISSITINSINLAPDNAINTEISEIKLITNITNDKKCIRCWHYLPEIGTNNSYQDLCNRCICNLFETGEIRKYC